MTKPSKETQTHDFSKWTIRGHEPRVARTVLMGKLLFYVIQYQDRTQTTRNFLSYGHDNIDFVRDIYTAVLTGYQKPNQTPRQLREFAISVNGFIDTPQAVSATLRFNGLRISSGSDRSILMDTATSVRTIGKYAVANDDFAVVVNIDIDPTPDERSRIPKVKTGIDVEAAFKAKYYLSQMDDKCKHITRTWLEGLRMYKNDEPMLYEGVCGFLNPPDNFDQNSMAYRWCSHLARAFGQTHKSSNGMYIYVDTPRIMTPRRREFVEYALLQLDDTQPLEEAIVI